MANHIRKLAAAAALAGLGYIWQTRAERGDWQRFQPPGRRIDLGGRRLYLHPMGEQRPGRPVILLESGHGDWSMAWRKVQPALARFARVVAYDRAGFGWSDPGPLPRTPEVLVSELHELLERAGERGPYLFVGHSMGAALGRLFHRRYPGEVLGMVWVDSAHEDLAHYLPFWPLAYPAFLGAIRPGSLLARLGLIRLLGGRPFLAGYTTADPPPVRAAIAAQLSTGKFYDVLYDETVGLMQRKHWPQGPTPLGDLPVISVEAAYTPQPPWYYPRREWQQFLAGWQHLHDDLCRLSSRVERVPVGCGHVVMVEQPQVVIQAVRTMYEIITQAPIPAESTQKPNLY